MAASNALNCSRAPNAGAALGAPAGSGLPGFAADGFAARFSSLRSAGVFFFSGIRTSPLRYGNLAFIADHAAVMQPGAAVETRRRYTEGMENAEIQIVSNESGEPTAVIVPIQLWREIESERETAYLLKSETMKQRLLAARQREGGLSLDAVVEKLRI
jgi:PHD/YefM family antitoxin component YafN of YafNO toxin-antitoxin module